MSLRCEESQGPWREAEDSVKKPVDPISCTLDGRKYLVHNAGRFVMASPQHQRDVSAGRQSVRSGAFLAIAALISSGINMSCIIIASY